MTMQHILMRSMATAIRDIKYQISTEEIKEKIKLK
jgi:hypothetical protein